VVGWVVLVFSGLFWFHGLRDAIVALSTHPNYYLREDRVRGAMFELLCAVVLLATALRMIRHKPAEK